MNRPVTPTVTLIATTQFLNTHDVPWDSEGFNGQDLVEFAGRACYQSWDRPNPRTATNAGYLAHIAEIGHFSTYEHAYATFYITGVSRSLTHELVRHRHFNYSQLSQRYVDSESAGFVVPPEMLGDRVMELQLQESMRSAVEAYRNLVDSMREKLEREGVSGTEARKRARQAARAVMPNMTETRIVVTGNYRAWRHFLDMRAAAPADVEIRRVAVEIGRQLATEAPNAFSDFAVVVLPDGTEALERAGTLR